MKRVPAEAAKLETRLRQTLAVPEITGPVVFDGNKMIVPPEFLGWRFGTREDVLLMLNRRQCLPFSFDGVISDEDFALAYETLTAHSFFRYSVTAQALLDNVLVAKTVLREWFAARGFQPPWSDADQRGSQSESDAPAAIDVDSPSPGRPRKRAWGRIEDLVRRLYAEDSDQLFKCIAHQVLELVVAEFPPDEIPSFATLQKSIGRIIKG